MYDYINVETLEKTSEYEIRQITGYTQAHIENHHLDGTPFRKLIVEDYPLHEEWEMVKEVHEELYGYYKISYLVIDNPDITKIQVIKNRIAHRRWLEEVGGIEYMGMAIPTDRDTQSILTAMNLRVDRNPEHTESFKMGNGVWITLDREMIIEIGNVVFDHVRNCFKREQELNVLLDSGEDVTEEDW